MDPLYQLNMGLLFLNEGKIDLAIVHLQKCIQLDPKNYKAYNALGLSYTIKREWDKAISYFEKSLVINPEFTEVHNNLGIIYQEKGDFERAKKEFQKVISDQNYQQKEIAYYNLARFYYIQKNYEESFKMVNLAIEKRNNYSIAHNLKGLILQEKGRLKEAEQSFRKALEFTPDDIVINENLIRILLRLGKEEEALIILNKILPLAQDQETKERLKNILEQNK